ncbi:MAG: cohesin domain-containing protein [Caldilineaceae bacterium]
MFRFNFLQPARWPVGRRSLLLAVLLSLLPFSVYADSPPTYITEWTGFNFPAGVVVDSSDNVYVADTNNHRIVKLSSTGDSRTVWTGFNLPKGVAVDSRDNVYVADTNNTRIVKYSSTGAYLTEWGVWGVFKYPGGVAVDSSDNVYVADTSNGRIVKYGSTNLKVDGAGVSLVNGNQVNVPVKFAGNGKQIASVGFVLNYDTACLAFDPTDNNEDDIPDAITGLPAAFIPSISHNTNQKLEVALYSNPVATLTDGTLFTVQFMVNANCLPDAATPTKTMTVGFDASPAPSFGDAGGADVDGTTTDGTITLTYGNSAPTDLALSNNKVTDGSAAGTTVGTLSTLDLDSGDSFTYSFSNSANCPNTDNASFTLTGNTLQTAVAIDYATKSSYTICLRSTDSGGIFVERSFTILVIGTPVAVDDLVEPRTKVLLSGETQVIDVLANDQAKGATLSVASITQPAAGKGSATNNNTNVSYSAPATGNGTARFTYQATNGDFTSTSANVDVSYVANDLRGDCNANGSVTAADFIATVLEIFDSSDDNKDAAGKPAWWLIYNGSYAAARAAAIPMASAMGLTSRISPPASPPPISLAPC